MHSLQQLIAEELGVAVQPRINSFAAYIAAQYPGAARAVLFYGSCLRSEELEGQMLDFYLIVSDYEAAYGKSWLAKWNRRLPPNVFPFQHDGLVAKVAVLSEKDFHDLNRPGASAVSVWARFAQPARLVWVSDDIAARAASMAIAGAAPTLLNAALAHMAHDDSIIDLWELGFAMTYSAELRAERSDRPASVVQFDPDRYRAFGKAALLHTPILNELRADGSVHLLPDPEARALAERERWPALRRRGKMLTVARLAKAAFTYSGGIDYLAWKINRHAGTQIEIKPWQRKWPLVAALVLVPKLWVKGAVR
ncbi:hypothetical protein [Sphingorhabdus sp.]|jgi:hypothetical protein|uniref:hypothetical protein n=2 Tax=Sphingorhabdus sp. TaxID=1902408 RepID=UPI003BB12138|nr:hypothetical protein [Sphingomonadales bacterium]MBK9432278.1 hypothetical protein [Sphingomonadales bacterium]MBL0022186.1 hypothetical protein [Sphingomonadales bacterium]